MKTRWLAAFVALSLILCSCSTHPPQESEIKLSINLQCDEDIYALHCEYLSDRSIIGGLQASGNPKADRPLDASAPVILVIPEHGFPEGTERVNLGIFLFVALENQQEVVIPYLLKWQADFTESFSFILTGDSLTGFELQPTGDFECKITPWAELPNTLVDQ